MKYRVKKCACKTKKGKLGKYEVYRGSKSICCCKNKVQAYEFISKERKRIYENVAANIVLENVLLRLMIENSSSKKSFSGSYPDENYKLEWHKFEEEWFDEEGLTTWEEDRETVKQYFKKMKLL